MSQTTHYRIKKTYFKIGIVARYLRETYSCIHFWMKEFGLQVKRDGHGNRYFTRGQVRLLLDIRRLLRDERYTLEGAKRKFNQGQRIEPEPYFSDEEGLIKQQMPDG